MITVVSVCESYQVVGVGRSLWLGSGWVGGGGGGVLLRRIIVTVAADARANRFGVTERRSSDGGGVPVPPSPPRIWVFRVVQ